MERAGEREQYQGEYADFEEELDWNDFALRSYDPQLGRWLQQDPYDEFSSPYVGMGNDPANLTDPSGGSIGSLIDGLVGFAGQAASVLPEVIVKSSPTFARVGLKLAVNGIGILNQLAQLNINKDFISKSLNNNISNLNGNSNTKNSIYMVFDGAQKRLKIYSNNGTDDLNDDDLLGVYEAYNNVDGSSKGKWEDGEYIMEDQIKRWTHPRSQVDGLGIPVDTEDGMYGQGGICRAKPFKGNVYTRTGMAIHAGRLHWNKGINKGKVRPMSTRLTMGCIRVSPSTMNAIDEAIKNYGRLKKIYVLRNRTSINSEKVNNIRFNVVPKELWSNNFFDSIVNWLRNFFSSNK